MRLVSRYKFLSLCRKTLRVSLVTTLLWSVVVAPGAHANTLVQSSYRSFSGDVNGDGRSDVLLKASSRIVLIPLDDLSLPVPIPPKNATFVLISNSDGTYSLAANPADTVAGSSVWQTDSYELVYGDVLGNGLGSVLIKAKASGAPSFVVALTSPGTLQLIQQLTPATLGIDLGAPGTTAELKHSNSDGRTDLAVSTNGRIAAVFIADQNGIFRRDDEASIRAVWSGLLKAFENADANMAAQYLVEESREQYRQAFADLGSDLQKIPAAFSTIRALSRTDAYAEYVFTQNVGGKTTMHIVPFVRRGGLWSMNGF